MLAFNNSKAGLFPVFRGPTPYTYLIVTELANKRVLITGATGFIGQHLAEHMIGRVGALSCLVRKTANTGLLTTCDVQLIGGDVTDLESVQRALNNVDVVFHLAGAISALNKQTMFRVNTGGTGNVVTAAARVDTPPKLIYVSSMAAAGPAHAAEPRTEMESPAPVSDYGRSKLAGEAWCHKYCARLPITIIRPAVVYGERDRSSLELFRPISKGFAYFAGQPAWPLSLIDVRDLVRLLCAAVDGPLLRPDSAAGLYNGVGPQSPPMSELAELLAAALGVASPRPIRVPAALMQGMGMLNGVVARVTRKPRLISPDKVRELVNGPWLISGAQAERELGFVPQTSLDTGLSRVAQWYQENGWI